MKAQLVLRFDNTDELIRVLQLLKENGLEKLTFQPTQRKHKKTEPASRTWSFGIANLEGKLDHINLRDYAYDDE